jgi:hypothetical protein
VADEYRVRDLGQCCDFFGRPHQLGTVTADAAHRHLVKAELERIGHAHDLQDSASDEAVGAGMDGRLAEPISVAICVKGRRPSCWRSWMIRSSTGSGSSAMRWVSVRDRIGSTTRR